MTYKQGDKVTIQDVNGELVDVTIEKIIAQDSGQDLYRSGKRIFTGDRVVSIPPQSDSDELKQVIADTSYLMRKIGEPRDAEAVLGTNERALVLEEAEQLINGQRAKDYGDPATNFGRLAKLWAPILGAEITPTQVALCLTQLKISRLINTPDHRDSYIDAAGYIALGAELAKEKK